MAAETLGEVLRRIGRNAGLQGVLALTDAQLLERFAAGRDEPAFAALMVRHGPMVLGVCRRLLPDAGQAEDAFQAAFLVLARKAGAIRRRPLLSAWLYGVAYKVAARLRGRLWRRHAREKPADFDAFRAADEAEPSDLAPVVQAEVQRLPDKYRDPVVLCYLEGKTHEEAARLLAWPLGTVKGRLARARDLLRSRLMRRGLAPSEGACTAALAIRPATPPTAVVDATVRAAPLVAAGDPTGGGLASARAVLLSQGVVRTMMLTNWKIAAALGLTALLLAGTGGYVYQTARGEPGAGPTPAARGADKPAGADKAKDDKDAIQGTWQVTGVEMGGKEAPDNDETKRMKSAKWVISADKITITGPGQEEHNVSFKLDPTKKPKEIDVTPLDGPENEKGILQPAIYSLEGDVLKVGLSAPTDGSRPTELATKEGGNTMLLTLRREQPEKDKPADKPKDDKEAIQGVWQVTGVEMGGKDVSGTDEFKDLATAKWTFAADKILFKSGKPDMSAAYKIDPSKKPKELDVTPLDGPENEKGHAMPAIYSLEGDVLKICVGSPDAPGRPTELASKEGTKTLLVTYKRVEGGKDNPADKSKDQEALQGAWQVTDFEVKGKGPDEADLKKIKGTRWVFSGDQLIIQEPGEKENAASYNLDASKTPKEIDVTPPEGQPRDKPEGIYSLDGDTLKLCFAGPGGGPRPSELAAKEGGKTVVLTLKRVKEDKDKSADKSKDDEAIQGTWQVKAVETGGKDVTGQGEFKNLSSAEWIIASDKLIIHLRGKPDQTATYKLDPSNKPKELDVTPLDGPPNEKGKLMPAIYSLDGDVLRVCIGSPTDATRPTELATKEGGAALLVTFQRVEARKDK